MAAYVIIEYGEPVSPGNRHPFEPVEGAGPAVFEATAEEAAALMRRLGADSPFRVLELAHAVKLGLMPAEPETVVARPARPRRQR